jgi:plasmid stabilization system protein ParE
VVKPTQIIWSYRAEKDLKSVYDFYAQHSEELADKIIAQIVSSPNGIIYEKQYQEDEFLGSPYRRYFVNHWRVVYKSNNDTVTILRVFDTRQSPDKLK